jgi:hypothetical protein
VNISEKFNDGGGLIQHLSDQFHQKSVLLDENI